MRAPFVSSAALLASLAAAAVLAGGVLVTPLTSEAGVLLIQDQAKGVTVTGLAVGPDDQPVAKVPVTIKMESEGSDNDAGGSGGGGNSGQDQVTLSAASFLQFKTVGKALTTADGKFTIKNVKVSGPMRLEIGQKLKSPWTISSFTIEEGKDVDLGKIQLREKINR